MIPVSAVDDVVLNDQYVSQHRRLRGRALSVEPRPARVVAGTDGERMLRGEERLVSPVLMGRGEEPGRLAALVSAPPAVAVVEGEAGVGSGTGCSVAWWSC